MTKLIGEIGINHDSSFKKLIKLSDMFLEAGFDYIKIQLRTPELCVPKDQWNVPKQWFDGTWTTYIDYKRRMEISDDQLALWMKQYQGKAFASVWDIPSLEKLVKHKPPYIKIPSALLVDDNLISMAIDTGIPVILSTGMSTLEEIDHAVSLFHPMYNLILMHCTSTYPTNDNEVNLLVIKTLRDRYGVPVGFSNHSASPMPSIYSMILGAWGVEIHGTLSRTDFGSDHAASLEEKGLKLVARERNRIPELMGNGQKEVYSSEVQSLLKLRGSSNK